MTAVIETDALSKRYGNHQAVRDLSIHVPFGSVCAFLGQNGAGKSTTLRMLLGMMYPTSGSGRIFGLRIDDQNESLRIRQRAAFVAEDKRLYDYMTIAQIISFTRSFFPGWRVDLESRLLKQFGLPLSLKIRKLSKGMRTKLALLLGIARGCELLILDEPTEGLDPVSIEEVLQIIVTLIAEGTSVFFSSHQIAEVEQIADHVLMIDRGQLVLNASLDRLKERYRRIQAVFPAPPEKTSFNLTGVQSVNLEGRVASLIVSENADGILAHTRMMHATSVEVLPLSLREVFLETVKARQ